MIAQNIAHQALIAGHAVLFAGAGHLLGDLCALDSDSTLRRRLRHYARPQFLVIDKVGNLSYSSRYADVMFELVSRRCQAPQHVDHHQSCVRRLAPGPPPNAACVVLLIHRMVHNAEIVAIDGES